MDTHLAKIQTARAIAPGIYDFTLSAPQLAKEARPGQFVHIRLPGHTLRRPISICSASAAEGTVRLVFAVRGEGTRALAAMGREETLDLLGPLGNSFMPEYPRSKFGSVRPEAGSACGDGAACAPEFIQSKCGSCRPEAGGACGDGAACDPELARSKFASVLSEAGSACGDGAACAPEFIQSKCGGSRPEAESVCGDGAACAPEKSRSADGRVMLVGGGIGVPPMLFLAQALHGDCIAVLGFRSAESAILAEEFRALGCDTRIATEDGSLGEKGFVTDCFPQSGISAIAACGPVPMLRAVASYAKARAIPCAVSLEARMACGVGACLGCACSLLREDGTAYYGHVCKDGPVFDAARVAWEGAQA